MKLLFTSDLHMYGDTVDNILCVLRKKLAESNPDVLVISGDVSDMPSYNTYSFFSEFDLPVVFCLGNHEFARSSVNATLEKYVHDYEVCVAHNVKNIHCLDTEGHFDTQRVRFYGNVLWYDGSLYNGMYRTKYINTIYEGWLDSTIVGFNAIDEHRKCVAQIRQAQRNVRKKKLVLVTHCVPLRKLNQFDIDTPMGIPNCYSGVDNLFDSYGIHPDLALCGHTHRRVECEHVTMEGKKIKCVNSGNDYYFRTGKVVFDELEI